MKNESLNRWMYRVRFTSIRDLKKDQINKFVEKFKLVTSIYKDEIFRVFKWENNLIVYGESNSSIQSSIKTFLEQFGDVRQMLDIFHDDSLNLNWRKNAKPYEELVGSVIQLKPEKFASYVFLHFQFQEENRTKFNRTYIIGSDGVFLFSYFELPAVISKTVEHSLGTSNSPKNWEEVMQEHFEPWSDKPNEKPWWRRSVLVYKN